MPSLPQAATLSGRLYGALNTRRNAANALLSPANNYGRNSGPAYAVEARAEMLRCVRAMNFCFRRHSAAEAAHAAAAKALRSVPDARLAKRCGELTATIRRLEADRELLRAEMGRRVALEVAFQLINA